MCARQLVQNVQNVQSAHPPYCGAPAYHMPAPSSFLHKSRFLSQGPSQVEAMPLYGQPFSRICHSHSLPSCCLSPFLRQTDNYSSFPTYCEPIVHTEWFSFESTSSTKTREWFVRASKQQARAISRARDKACLIETPTDSTTMAWLLIIIIVTMAAMILILIMMIRL